MRTTRDAKNMTGAVTGIVRASTGIIEDDILVKYTQVDGIRALPWLAIISGCRRSSKAYRPSHRCITGGGFHPVPQNRRGVLLRWRPAPNTIAIGL